MSQISNHIGTLFSFANRAVGPFIVLLVLITQASAQNIGSPGFSAKLGGSLITGAVKDESFSSLPYEASVPGFSVAVKLEKKSLQEIEFNFHAGDFKTDGGIYSLRQTYFSVRYFYLFDLFPNRSKILNFKLGPGINAFSAERDYSGLINKNSSYENALSLNASFQIGLNLNGFVTGVSLSNRFSLPVISSIRQPAYDSELSPGQIAGTDSKSNLFKDREFASFKKYDRLINTLALGKQFHENHELAFSYKVDNYRFKTGRKVDQSMQGFSLSYTYKFR